ncbi:MAG: YHS domain-containing protein [Candidatus Eisenbacteria bacterium]|nr:YHS domain-containing protein [Candidatus Eisenbacteria bacterium]
MKRSLALIAVLGLSAMLALAGCSQSDSEAQAGGSVEDQPMMGEGAEYEGKVVTADNKADCVGECTEECIETCMAENAKAMPADEAHAMCAEKCAETCGTVEQASSAGGCPGAAAAAANDPCAGCPKAKAAASADMHQCVVCACGKDIQTDISMEHEGATYYFCSEGCRNKFSDRPGKYIN